MKTLSKLQQLSFIIQREFLAISTSYAVLLVLIGGIFVLLLSAKTQKGINIPPEAL